MNKNMTSRTSPVLNIKTERDVFQAIATLQGAVFSVCAAAEELHDRHINGEVEEFEVLPVLRELEQVKMACLTSRYLQTSSMTTCLEANISRLEDVVLDLALSNNV